MTLSLFFLLVYDTWRIIMTSSLFSVFDLSHSDSIDQNIFTITPRVTSSVEFSFFQTLILKRQKNDFKTAFSGIF
jgi:hypothetical protein